MNKPEELEWRMYGIVPYNISDIQKGIQFGHAVQEYNNLMLSINELDENSEYIIKAFNKWRETDKTFMVMNGGTTNDDPTDKFYGSMNILLEELRKINIIIGLFREPDLGNQITGIVFLVDERCFKKRPYSFEKNLNPKIYPDFKDWYYNLYNKEVSGDYTAEYNDWIDLIGGEQNLMLRNFIEKLRFA
jgi:hypothetical protein